jgi:copper chaperone CopZ
MYPVRPILCGEINESGGVSMSMIELALNDVACSSCLGKIKKGIKRHRGIEKVSILSGSGKISINYNEDIIQLEEINQTVFKLATRTFD